MGGGTVGATTVALLVAGMAAFGTGTPTSRLVGDLPAFLASGLRCLLGAVILLPIMAVRRRAAAEPAVPRLDRRDALVLAGIAAFGMFGFSLLMLYGMREVSGSVGSVVMASTPAVTALGAIAFMGDRLGWSRGAGIALTVGGVLTVNLAGGFGGGAGGTVWLGTVLVLGAVCGEAAYTLLGKRLTADLSALEVSALASAAGAVLFLPFAVWQGLGMDWGGPSASDWIALAWWGAGTLALGSLLWYSGVQRVPGSVAAGFMGVMPVSALVTSYWLLDEAFRPIHVVGMGFALAGMAAVAWSHRDSAAAPSHGDDDRRRIDASDRADRPRAVR